jgi:hypothetical protein
VLHQLPFRAGRPTFASGHFFLPAPLLQRFADSAVRFRIRYFTLRLAKSDVFTPRLWEAKWLVDEVRLKYDFLHKSDLSQYLELVREQEEVASVQTGGIQLQGRAAKLPGSEADWDSGYSDG